MLRLMSPQERKAYREEKRVLFSNIELPEEGQDELSRILEEMRRVKEERRLKWIQDVLDTDTFTQEKGKNASHRAQNTLISVDQVLDDNENDTVGQIKSSLARMNEDCQQKLKALMEEERQQMIKKLGARQFKRLSDSDAYKYNHLKVGQNESFWSSYGKYDKQGHKRSLSAAVAANIP